MPGANCEYPPNRSNDSNSDSLGEHHISNTILNSDSLVIGWRFVVGTYDNDFLRLYVDGELVALISLRISKILHFEKFFE